MINSEFREHQRGKTRLYLLDLDAGEDGKSEMGKEEELRRWGGLERQGATCTTSSSRWCVSLLLRLRL